MSTSTSKAPSSLRISSHEVLHIAELDAEAIYQDLTGYRITLALEPDGWHVDYELASPLMAGGGPHYIIDCHTGQILSKRYEQ